MQPLREEMKGRDLPKKWQKKAAVGPDETVIVTILPGESKDDLTKQLLDMAEQLSAEAEKRGLTEEKLSQLLDEAG